MSDGGAVPPPKKQNAPEAVRLRTRECHSALNAMRRLRQECKRNLICSCYSRFDGATMPKSDYFSACLFTSPLNSSTLAADSACAPSPRFFSGERVGVRG